jgi:hypothetical protein
MYACTIIDEIWRAASAFSKGFCVTRAVDWESMLSSRTLNKE